MKLKMDGDKVVLQDGKPVYIDDAGQEIAFDVVGTTQTIARLNTESKAHRERAEKAEGKIKKVSDLGLNIEEPEKLAEAVKTVANYKDKQLIDAGQVETVKQQMKTEFDKQMGERTAERDQARKEIIDLRIGGSFTGSKFIGDKLNIPADMARAFFGNSFKIEEGKVVGYDKFGQRIMSKANPGELAEFDEALNQLVDAYPGKETIYKPTQQPGGGTPPGSKPNGQHAGTTMRRSQFDALPASEQSRISIEGKTAIVD